ncbi:hypothetical protein Ancab_028857 [Ancistrocladus abbreviatus]
MESLGAFLDGEWESICKMFSTEESEFSLPFLDHHPLIPNTEDDGLNLETPSAYACDGQDISPESICYGAAYDPPDVYFSQDQSSHSLCSHENYCLDMSNQLLLPNDQISSSMDFCLMDGTNNGSSLTPLLLQGMMMDEAIAMKGGSSSHQMDNPEDNQSANVGSPRSGGQVQLKGKSDSEDNLQAETDEKTSSSPAPKKRARTAKDNGRKGKRKMQSKLKKNEEEETNNNGGSNGQSSSCDMSDNESNALQEANEGVNSEGKEAPALNSSGKKKASRGAATDLQSLYARRRERINERLRILQNLVPNGTKVDISTMLEEAVHYVKFLQLQIKLLNSDELWMFAPLAYNGIDIGLYRRMSPFLLGP